MQSTVSKYGFREGRLCKGTQEQCVRNLLMWIQLCKGVNVMSLTCLRAFGSEAFAEGITVAPGYNHRFGYRKMCVYSELWLYAV